MSLFDRVFEAAVESFSTNKFEKTFRQVLNEGTITRTDKLGNKVKIPPGYSYMEGPDNVGVAIAPCAKATVDNVGRVHSVPKGHVLKIGKNGKGVVVVPGEPTRETKQGQIELLKKIMKP